MSNNKILFEAVDKLQIQNPTRDKLEISYISPTHNHI